LNTIEVLLRLAPGGLLIGEWPRLLISHASPIRRGAPFFPHVAKGGRGNLDVGTKSGISGIATYPCKRGKDGAPG
jgi:hypothetical protein